MDWPEQVLLKGEHHGERSTKNCGYWSRKCWSDMRFCSRQMKIADIVLLDIYEGFAKGKALDMSQNANVLNYNGTITGTADYKTSPALR